MDLVQRVEQRLKTWAAPQARILCAVSGGPDSVALAHALKSLSYPIVIGHVDHQLRKNSANDERFVFSLAERWDLPYSTAQVHVLDHAAARKIGIEEAARDLRYAALRTLARRANCSVMVTGHTADDQAETVLMNFLRGAGPAGLAGIPPRRTLLPRLDVVRPLLDCTRQEVLNYLNRHRLPFRKDPSNRSPRFTRNRIRLQLLPLLEKQYPGLRARLAQVGEIFREEEALWGEKIKREFNKTVRQDNTNFTVDLAQLLGYHKALGRRILRHLLTGISFQDTERVFQLAHSQKHHSTLQLMGGLRIERRGQQLLIPKRIL